MCIPEASRGVNSEGWIDETSSSPEITGMRSSLHGAGCEKPETKTTGRDKALAWHLYAMLLLIDKSVAANLHASVVDWRSLLDVLGGELQGGQNIDARRFKQLVDTQHLIHSMRITASFARAVVNGGNPHAVHEKVHIGIAMREV
jgi:hypothetical protein